VPHFLSLAWMYRDDYQRGGFVMLPSVTSPLSTSRVVLIYSLALIPLGILPTLVGMSSWVYGVIALISGIAISQAAMGLIGQQSSKAAKRVFISSLLYLPAILAAMVSFPQPLPPATGTSWRVLPGAAQSIPEAVNQGGGSTDAR
jgi:heme o synthase